MGASKPRSWQWLLICCAVLVAGCGGKLDPEGTSQMAPTAGVVQSQSIDNDVPASCPVTRPQHPSFVPPAPYSKQLPGQFWYGTPTLWTSLEPSGTWQSLPYHDGAYSQKVFWWRQRYDWRSEPNQPLTVTGVRIDGSAPPLVASTATNAFAQDIGSAMLVGVAIPTGGCWQITGRIKGMELSFIVWIPT